MTASYLLRFATSNDQLPQRTIFYNSPSELIFNPEYKFYIDWDERLRTCKDRIFRVLSQGGMKIDDNLFTIADLRRVFEEVARRG